MERIVIGVAGGSGSGKTTVVRGIVDALGANAVTVLHHDAYYKDAGHLPSEARADINFDHPDALETTLLVRHLDALLGGQDVEVPIYDFANHTRTPTTRRACARKVIILDGLLILWDAELRRRMDIKVFVDADADLRLMRRLRRDMAERGRTAESVMEQYARTVRPMHLEFVEPSKRWADVILPGGRHNRVAVDMLVTKVRTILEGA